MLRPISALLSIIFLLSAQLALATDFSSSNFTVKDPVIQGGGGFATSSSFQLWGTIPYIGSALATSTSFRTIPGFLGFPGSASSSSSTASSSAGIAGGGGIATETLPLPPKPKPSAEVLRILDCNADGRINLVDLSCLLYYTDKTGPEIEPHDFNKDGVVDLVDVSILLYYWYDPV